MSSKQRWVVLVAMLLLTAALKPATIQTWQSVGRELLSYIWGMTTGWFITRME